MVVPVGAGSLRPACDRHGPQRQPARLYHHDGNLCGGGGRVDLVNTLPRPPFTGEISVQPDPLLQVMPEAEASQSGIDDTARSSLLDRYRKGLSGISLPRPAVGLPIVMSVIAMNSKTLRATMN